MTKQEVAKFKKEPFQNTSNETNITAQIGPNFLKNRPILNIRNSSLQETVDPIFSLKCPPYYHKIGDICCPVPLENGKCPAPNSIDKTRYNGMPICALNRVASVNWGKLNNNNVLHLCSDLPKTTGSFKRNIINKMCNSNMDKINGKCYNKCPEGFISNGNKCTPKEFVKVEFNGTCPKNSELDKKSKLCLEKCPFGFESFNNYCVPSDLANV